MTISFNTIPSNIRTPFTAIEFDNSLAVQGPTAKVFKAIIMGQKLSGGTATANVLVRVTSPEQAKTLFGGGSMLHEMFKKWFESNDTTEVYGLPLADNGAGVAATGTLTFTGTATEAGTAVFYVGGQKIEVPVAVSDDGEAIAASFVSAVGDLTDASFTAAVGGVGSEHIVTITYKHKGTVGNGIDIRQGYYDDEKGLPAGVAAAIVAMASGATNPTLTDAIAAIPDEQYDIVAAPWTDSTSLAALNTEMEDRWGPMNQSEGMIISAAKGSAGTLGTLGDTHNKKLLSIIGAESSPHGVHEWAASYGAVLALHLNIDPARPVQTLELSVLPSEKKDGLTRSERNLLLYDGISTYMRSADGAALIERGITTYKVNELSAVDVSYLDVETIFTLSYLRYDFRNFILRKYPRHKLGSDGVRVAPGQAILTPKVAKAEAIAKFREWEELGLVENFDGFAEGLIVERNQSDVNRLDWLMTPDVMNQLRVNAVKISFLL